MLDSTDRANGIQAAIAADPLRVIMRSEAPVWPCKSQQELEQLQTLAQRRFASVYTDDLAGAPTRFISSVGMVAALDQEALATARLFAQLTGREAACCTSLQELLALRPQVIIGLWKHAGPELLEAAWTLLADGLPCGLILANDVEDLRRQVLFRAAIRALPAPQLKMLDVLSSEIGLVSLGSRVFCGKQATRAEVADSFARHHAALTIWGHSDGVDGEVVNDVLCPLVDLDHSSNTPGGPNCLHTGRCHRLSLPREQAFESGRLVGASRFSCNVLSWFTCFGTLFRGSMIEPQWSFGAQLCRNPNLGALLTTWETAATDGAELEPALELLASGATVGNAAVMMARGVASTTRRARLCLFGDPDVKALDVPYADSRPFTVMRAERRVAPPQPSGSLLKHLTRDLADDERESLLSAATPWLSGQRDGNARAAASALLNAIALRVRVWDEWPLVSESMRELRSHERLCGTVTGHGACRLPVRRLTAALRVSPWQRRHLDLCPRCGVVADHSDRVDAPRIRWLSKTSFAIVNEPDAIVSAVFVDREALNQPLTGVAQLDATHYDYPLVSAGYSRLLVLQLRHGDIGLVRTLTSAAT